MNTITTNLVTTDASLNAITTNLVTTDASLNTLTGIVELKRDISNLLFDGSMQLAGNLIPNTTGIYDIGTSTKRFRSIYVDEAHLSTNTLYIGDTPILGTNANTIEIKADTNQSIDMITTGSGNSKVQSEHDITILTSGANADIKVQATGTNSKVRLSGTGGIEMTSNVDAQANLLVGGNLTVTGNVISNGTQFTVNSTTVTTTDNIIVLNSGEVGTGVTSGVAGLQVDRGDSSDFQLLFDESTDKIKTGFIDGSFTNIASETYVDASVNPLASRITINETDIGILDVSMNAVETRVTINETSIGVLDTSMNALETRVTINETDIGILDVSMNSVEGRIAANETSVGTLDTSMNAVEGRITANETSVGTLDTSMNAVEGRITANETSVGTLDTSMNAVEGRITANETSVGTLDTSMNAVEGRITDNEASIGVLDTSMNAVETRATITETDIGILDTSMNAVETRVTITETDIGILDVSMNAVETRVTINETDIGVLDTSMNAVEGTLELKANLNSPTFTGTVTAATFVGDGSQLTGLSTSNDIDGNLDVSGNLTVSNPNEITYKNQTLDARFVNVAGGTMTGDYTIQGDLKITAGNSGDCVLTIEADNDDNAEGDLPFIRFNQDGERSWSEISSQSNALTFGNSVFANGGIIFKTGSTDGVENAVERMKIGSNGDITMEEDLTVDGDLDVSGNLITDSIEGGELKITGDTVTLASGTSLSYTKLHMTENLIKIGIAESPDNLEVTGEVICTTVPSANDRLTNKLYVDGTITTAINGLTAGAGTAYDTLLELENEIQANDTSLNTVFTNVATKVSKSGDTMTGDLTVANDAEINYKTETLDTRFVKEVDKHTMTAELAMGNNKITGCANPTDDNDVANKDYVDDADDLKLDLTGGTISGDLTVIGSASIAGDLVVTGEYPPFAMSAAIENGYTASASSEYHSGSHPAWEGFNDNPTQWQAWLTAIDKYASSGYNGTESTTADTGTINGEWIQIEKTGTSTQLLNIKLQSRENSASTSVKDIVLLGYAASGWKQIQSWTNLVYVDPRPSGGGDAYSVNEDITDTSFFEKYRIVVQSTVTTTYSYASIGEIILTTVSGATSLGGDLTVVGATTLDTLTASGDADLNGDLQVVGNANIEGTLDVSGNLTVSNPNEITYKTETLDTRFVKEVDKHTMSANLVMSDNKITGCATPTTDSDVAIKEYVDTKLSLTGGTLTGNLKIEQTGPAPYNPHIVLDSRGLGTVFGLQNQNVSHAGKSTLYLTESFVDADDYVGGFIQYDGDDNKLLIGSSSGENPTTAISIGRNSADVDFQGGITAASMEAGKGFVGTWNSNADWAVFCNEAKKSSGTDYAMIHSSAGQTIINAASTKSIDFRIANLSKMTVASNGNVGIGTTNPQQKLEVHGNINLGKNDENSFIHSGGKLALSSDGAILIVADSNTTSGTTSSSSDIIFGTGSSTDMNSNRDFTFAEAYLSNVPRNEHMRIDGATGNVGIGTNNPVAELDVNGEIRSTTGVIGNSIHCDNRVGNGIASKDLGVMWIANGSSGATTTSGNWTAWNDTDSGLRFEWKSNIAVSSWYNKGYISKGSYTGIFNNFTGQHHNYGVSELIDEIGFIVSSTGNYRNQMTNCDECNKYKININESLPIVEYSQQINDTKVWGVISDKDDTNTLREKPFGNFVTEYEQAEEDRPLTINSLGEGALWVSNINGSITNGDYIATSHLPGLGIKQDDDILHSYTVAKITTDCSFDEMDMVPRKSMKYETVTKTREISKEVEKDVFERWEDDYDNETYNENIEQQIIDKILKTVQEEIITYDASGIPCVQMIEKTVEDEVPRVKQIESTDASGNNIITEVPEMETVSVSKTRKIPKMINVTLKDASNNDLLDSQGNPIIKPYQAKKAVYRKETVQEIITETYDVEQAVIDPDTHQYVYDIKTDSSGNTLYVEKYEMKYIVVSSDKYSVYNDGEHTDLYKDFSGNFTNVQINGESIIGKTYKMAFLGCTYHCG